MLNYFLYRAFLQSESQNIVEMSKVQDGEVAVENDPEVQKQKIKEVEKKLKVRLSFAKLYELYELVHVQASASQE